MQIVNHHSNAFWGLQSVQERQQHGYGINRIQSLKTASHAGHVRELHLQNRMFILLQIQILQ